MMSTKTNPDQLQAYKILLQQMTETNVEKSPNWLQFFIHSNYFVQQKQIKFKNQHKHAKRGENEIGVRTIFFSFRKHFIVEQSVRMTMTISEENKSFPRKKRRQRHHHHHRVIHCYVHSTHQDRDRSRNDFFFLSIFWIVGIFKQFCKFLNKKLIF